MKDQGKKERFPSNLWSWTKEGTCSQIEEERGGGRTKASGKEEAASKSVSKGEESVSNVVGPHKSLHEQGQDPK